MNHKILNNDLCDTNKYFVELDLDKYTLFYIRMSHLGLG